MQINKPQFKYIFLIMLVSSIGLITNYPIILYSSENTTWKESSGNYPNLTYTRGWVGIGSNSPKAPLDVSGGAEPFRVTNENHYLYTGVNRGNSNTVDIGGYNSQTKNHIDLVLSPNGGNVGVGTTPTSKLSINGTLEAKDFAGAGSKNILIGDDAYLTDIDQANSIGIFGNTNTSEMTLYLGNTGTKIKAYSNGDMCLGSC